MIFTTKVIDKLSYNGQCRSCGVVCKASLREGTYSLINGGALLICMDCGHLMLCFPEGIRDLTKEEAKELEASSCFAESREQMENFFHNKGMFG